jgi:hypothetical protein
VLALTVRGNSFALYSEFLGLAPCFSNVFCKVAESGLNQTDCVPVFARLLASPTEAVLVGRVRFQREDMETSPRNFDDNPSIYEILQMDMRIAALTF